MVVVEWSSYVLTRPPINARKSSKTGISVHPRFRNGLRPSPSSNAVWNIKNISINWGRRNRGTGGYRPPFRFNQPRRAGAIAYSPLASSG